MTRKTKSVPMEVGVVMGSDSDWPLLEETVRTLDGFGVLSEVRVLSAHRTPEEAAAYARTAVKRGLRVIIAAAGGAAHLAGVLAAHTILPVVGVPVGGMQDGLDALLATVQMPAGIPVATVAVGKAGAVNAALLAVQILATGGRADLQARLAQHKTTLRKKVAAGDARVQQALAKLRVAPGPVK
ncbi:MAG: 5-(carboxyamino)imidazole ribonucleotide mutase [bacterium]